MPDIEDPKLVRFLAEYENQSEKFLLPKKEFIKQYYGVYTSRLAKVSDSVTSAAIEKWGSEVPLKKLADLREEDSDKCILVGTLYKQQKLKPSILREISDENHVPPQPTTVYHDESDRVILEDGLNRIALTGKIEAGKTVTGVVCALLGYEHENGEFLVEDQIFYSPGPQRPLSRLNCAPLLVIVSGLDQSANNDFSLSLDLFQQWVYGNLPSPDGTFDLESAAICRIVVAGNSVQSRPVVRANNIQTHVPESLDILDSLKKVDELLSNLCNSVSVDLMPGEFDPANHMLPQQPMHYCMLPEVTQHKSFSGVPNPYKFAVEERQILGTSGQNVQDITKYADMTAMEALRSTLKWGHIAPTCPDTLALYPFTDMDPFVLDEYPHLYFAGNCPEFETELFTLGSEDKDGGEVQTRLVCVPRFCDTQSVAVVNLETLECHQVSFKINDLKEDEEEEEDEVMEQ